METHSLWRAVYCKPRQERKAEFHLENQGFEVFLPRVRVLQRSTRKRSWTRIQPMFPRYLFVRLQAHADDWSAIRSTRGAVRLVRFGDQVPPVPEQFIEALRERHAESGVIDISRAMAIKPGDPIEITDGALAGMRAVFQAESGEERVVILLRMLEHERRVEMPRALIRKAV